MTNQPSQECECSYIFSEDITDTSHCKLHNKVSIPNHMNNQPPQEQIVNHMKNMIDENAELSNTPRFMNTPQDKTWGNAERRMFVTNWLHEYGLQDDESKSSDDIEELCENLLLAYEKVERQKQHTALLDRVEEEIQNLFHNSEHYEKYGKDFEVILSTLRQHPLL